MPDLPKPTVSADVAPSPDGSSTGATVSVSRDGKSRSWVGSGKTTNEAVRDVVEKMLGDRRTGEFM
jgi:hypothetical protein